MLNNLIAVTSQDGAKISVSLHGGHVCSWFTPDGVEHLYLSPLTNTKNGSAIRGGIPVIFPQFAGRGTLPKHGFARNLEWTLLASGDGFITMVLSDSAASRAVFPHAFALTLHVTFSARMLNVALEILNTGDDTFTFTTALHTYLATITADTVLHGTQGYRYLEAVGEERILVADVPMQRFEREVNRVFLAAHNPLEMRSKETTLAISNQGFPDVVVWNPWEEHCTEITDLPDDAYQQFICVEAAVVEHPMVLVAGESWVGSQQLEVK